MPQNLKVLFIDKIYLDTVVKNIIATTKIRNNYVAIQSLIFSLLLLVKLSLSIRFASSFLVSVLCFFFDDFLSKVIALPTIATAIVVALLRS